MVAVWVPRFLDIVMTGWRLAGIRAVFNIDALCERLGITKGTVYAYFSKSEDDLHDDIKFYAENIAGIPIHDVYYDDGWYTTFLGWRAKKRGQVYMRGTGERNGNIRTCNREDTLQHCIRMAFKGVKETQKKTRHVGEMIALMPDLAVRYGLKPYTGILPVALSDGQRKD